MSLDARTLLRDQTADLHARIDGLIGALQLHRPDDYGRFLTIQAAAYLPVERALECAGAASALPDWPERRRSALLIDDMARLGLPLPPPCSTPDFTSAEAVLGGIYVLEGSRLGGAVLQRRVPADRPASFLAPSGGSGWRILLNEINRRLSTTEALDAAIAAARGVFQTFEHAARAVIGPPRGASAAA